MEEEGGAQFPPDRASSFFADRAVRCRVHAAAVPALEGADPVWPNQAASDRRDRARDTVAVMIAVIDCAAIVIVIAIVFAMTPTMIVGLSET